MNAALVSPGAAAQPVRLAGLAGWAVRTGRALEHWGRARAARRLGAGAEASARLTAQAAARDALAERDALIRSAAIPLR